jgi:hypothetical protein
MVNVGTQQTVFRVGAGDGILAPNLLHVANHDAEGA